MPFEVSIIRNNWTLRMRLRVVQLFLIMDTSSGIIPYVTLLLSLNRMSTLCSIYRQGVCEGTNESRPKIRFF